jgi:flagellar motor switch protein FliN
MTTATSLQELADEFRSCFVQVLGSMTGQEYSASSGPQEDHNPANEWRAYGLTGAATGAVSVGAQPGAAIRLGTEVLTAAGVETDATSAQSTFSELVSQALSAWSQKLVEKQGGTLEVDGGSALPGPPRGEAFRIAIQSGDQKIAELCLCLDDEFGAQFTKAPAEQPEPRRITGGTPSALDLLMDVELPVSVSFGRAQLPIKEVLKLSSGSIVELARNVSEPVELIVNNCVIARGEVVVIEGNYGIRIEEIVSAQERLRTLK